ncbi:MAG: MFS transporter [Bacteroidales bacterium]|nr:MFS transporter [Bacteroidales bacterium]MBO5978287.1 MFS transporter [Bacteroidales bacterium]
MKKRSWILVMLIFLGVVTFLDRINITVAGSAIMRDLNLTPDQWGWILSAFILSYGLMQIPMGAMGDKRGHRSTLALIVLWWSAFTAFTGMAGGFVSLILIRFMFGIGEAGSSPCSTGVISRWFPKKEVGKAQGFIWAASRMGGALTPFIVLPVITYLGWRAAFYILGAVGVIWSIVWYLFYRNQPKEMRGISAEEIAEAPVTQMAVSTEKVSIPWKSLLSSKQFWLILSMYFFYAFGSWFFFSWFPTFMELGRGFEKDQLTYAIAVPFVMSMIGNISGGYLTDKLSAKYGLKVGRKALGSSSLIVSAIFMFLAAFIPGKMQVFIFLSLAFGIIDLMLPSAWALCIDLGKKYSGAVSGAMNTAGNLGGFVCSLIFGYVVSATGNYNLPLYIIAGMLVISAIIFMFIDPTKQLIKDEENLS